MSFFSILKNTSGKHPVLFLFVMHTFFVSCIVFILRVFLQVPAEFFLKDDGYYRIGKSFFFGYTSLWHQFRGPGIPLVLSSLNFFPELLHPYLRILISQLITLLNIYLAFKIFSRYLPSNVIFWGLVISLFNPLYLWWACIKSSPEIYVTVFLGLTIFFSLRLIEKRKYFNMFALAVLISVSLFFKPVLFLIPFFLLIYFLFQKKYDLTLGISLIFVTVLLSLVGILKLSNPTSGLGYGDNTIMFDAFFTESLIETRQLGYNRGSGDAPEKNSNTEYIYTKIKEWTDKYQNSNGNLNPIDMNIAFIKEKIGIILLSKLFSPVYFISFADTTRKTIALFAINLTVLFFSVKNLKEIKNNFNVQISILIYIFVGYYSVYFLTTSIARYSIPFLFYISVFSGMTIVNLSKIFHAKAKK